eukprot:PhM_4_TR2087/c1_g3_i1/m.91418
MKTVRHMSEVHRSRHLRAITASEMHSAIRRPTAVPESAVGALREFFCRSAEKHVVLEGPHSPLEFQSMSKLSHPSRCHTVVMEISITPSELLGKLYQLARASVLLDAMISTEHRLLSVALNCDEEAALAAVKEASGHFDEGHVLYGIGPVFICLFGKKARWGSPWQCNAEDNSQCYRISHNRSRKTKVNVIACEQQEPGSNDCAFQ